MNQKIPLGLSFDDVLLQPQYSEIRSRSFVNLATQISPKIKLKLPFLSTNMHDVTGVEMAIVLGKLGGMGLLPRFENPKIQAEKVEKVKKSAVSVAASVGCREGFLERAEMLVKAGTDILLLDVAHGAMKQAIDATRILKRKFSRKVGIISGNIATYEAAVDLFKAGADGVRVGVGPGSICVTRIVTGVGVPQITAIMEVAKAAKRLKKYVLADGGIKSSGDAAKAIAAGADALCMGNIFAGTDEAPGKLIKIKGKKYKVYRGSTSKEAKEEHLKSLKDLSNGYTNYVEGVAGLVPYKGPVKNIVEEYTHALQSALSYIGAKNIQQFHKKAQFIQVTSLGLRENGVHDILIKD